MSRRDTLRLPSIGEEERARQEQAGGYGNCGPSDEKEEEKQQEDGTGNDTRDGAMPEEVEEGREMRMEDDETEEEKEDQAEPRATSSLQGHDWLAESAANVLQRTLLQQLYGQVLLQQPLTIPPFHSTSNEGPGDNEPSTSAGGGVTRPEGSGSHQPDLLQQLQQLLQSSSQGETGGAKDADQAHCNRSECNDMLNMLVKIRDDLLDTDRVRVTVGAGCALRMVVCAYAETQRVFRPDLRDPCAKGQSISVSEHSFAISIARAILRANVISEEKESMNFAHDLVERLKRKDGEGTGRMSQHHAKSPEWSIPFPKLVDIILQHIAKSQHVSQSVPQTAQVMKLSQKDVQPCGNCSEHFSELKKVCNVLSEVAKGETYYGLVHALIMMVTAYAKEAGIEFVKPEPNVTISSKERHHALDVTDKLLNSTKIASQKKSAEVSTTIAESSPLFDPASTRLKKETALPPTERDVVQRVLTELSEQYKQSNQEVRGWAELRQPAKDSSGDSHLPARRDILDRLRAGLKSRMAAKGTAQVTPQGETNRSDQNSPRAKKRRVDKLMK